MKGNICYSNDNKELCVIENGYVVSEDGICLGVYEQLPEKYQTDHSWIYRSSCSCTAVFI